MQNQETLNQFSQVYIGSDPKASIIIEDLNQSLKLLSNKVDYYQGENKKLNINIQQYKEKYRKQQTKMKHVLTVQNQVCEMQKNSFITLDGLYAEAVKDATNLAEQNKQLKKQNKQQVDTIKQLKTEILNLTSTQADLSKKIEEMTDQVDDLKEETDGQKEEMGKQNEQIKLLAEKNQKLFNENFNQSMKITQLEDQLDVLDRQSEKSFATSHDSSLQFNEQLQSLQFLLENEKQNQDKYKVAYVPKFKDVDEEDEIQ